MVDFVKYWCNQTEIKVGKMLAWIGISRSKFYDWQRRYGRANEHNGLVPRDYWITDEEKKKIIKYFFDNPLNGYRRLAFMMIDADVVFVSPTTVYNVLKKEGLLGKRAFKESKKGTGFNQPDAAHRHWHIDVSYVNIVGTFYYLCSILDGYSRYIVHWQLRESMKEAEIELIIEQARERFPKAKPRVITDNGPQFVAKDFKEYIRLCGMTHVRTSPYYPQSNGKIERWHRELKQECIRPTNITSYKEAVLALSSFVDDYNCVRLHSAIGYIAPIDKLEGREQQIFKARDHKLSLAREIRKKKRLRQSSGQKVGGAKVDMDNYVA